MVLFIMQSFILFILAQGKWGRCDGEGEEGMLEISD